MSNNPSTITAETLQIRQAIVRELNTNQLNKRQLHEIFKINYNLLSKHIMYLCNCGAVMRIKAKNRYVDGYYNYKALVENFEFNGKLKNKAKIKNNDEINDITKVQYEHPLAIKVKPISDLALKQKKYVEEKHVHIPIRKQPAYISGSTLSINA